MVLSIPTPHAAPLSDRPGADARGSGWPMAASGSCPTFFATDVDAIDVDATNVNATNAAGRPLKPPKPASG